MPAMHSIAGSSSRPPSVAGSRPDGKAGREERLPWEFVIRAKRTKHAKLPQVQITQGWFFAEVDERLTTQACSTCGSIGDPKGREGLNIRQCCTALAVRRGDRGLGERHDPVYSIDAAAGGQLMNQNFATSCCARATR